MSVSAKAFIVGILLGSGGGHEHRALADLAVMNRVEHAVDVVERVRLDDRLSALRERIFGCASKSCYLN